MPVQNNELQINYSTKDDYHPPASHKMSKDVKSNQNIGHAMNRHDIKRLSSIDGKELIGESFLESNDASSLTEEPRKYSDLDLHHRAGRDIFPLRPLFVYRLFQRRRQAEQRRLALKRANAKSDKIRYESYN